MDPIKPATNQKLTILLVDDQEPNILTLKGLLAEKGYKILTATDGPTALKIAESSKPDLILLDIKMPEMDGFEVCKRLKSSKETYQIPVIFLTVLGKTHDIVKGLELGAEDYVSKPFKSEELLARVRAHLNLKVIKDELGQKNQSLGEKNDELLLLNTTKDKLLSIISHDLRAPMGTLKEILDFIMEHYADLDTHKVHESLESIRDSIESSYTLVENLLFWARNQRGDISYEPAMNDVKKIITASIKLMIASAKTKNIKLKSNFLATEKAYFDSNMISVVIRNLINNAIKFTREGGSIVITVKDYQKDPENLLLVEVKDNGIGMNPNDLNIIFSNGTARTKSGTGLEKGSGLGLKLSREFVETNGGHISAESKPGEGSIFSFTLPKKAIQPAG